MRGQFHQVRWVLAKNTGSAEVIPFGIVEVTGAEHDRSNRAALNVRQPTSNTPSIIAINGWQPIPSGKYGLVTCEGPVYVAYSTGTPAVGEIWGPQTGSFLATKGNAGLIAVGTTTIGQGKTQTIALMNMPNGVSGGGHNRVAYTEEIIYGRDGLTPGGDGAGGPVKVQPLKLDGSPLAFVADGSEVDCYSWVKADSTDPKDEVDDGGKLFIFIEQDEYGIWWFTGQDCPPGADVVEEV